jgi:DNA-binding GntR family transcriptional regulator
MSETRERTPSDRLPRKGGAAGAGGGEALLPRPSSLADNVYDVLLGQLMSLQIQPGERLTMDNLSRELGVSQTPLREALGRLEANGLVIKTHLVGYRAAPQLSREQFEQLFEFRLLLEPAAAGRAADLLDEEKSKRLQQIARSMSSPAPGSHYRDFAAGDGEFHDYIASISGNPLIRESLARLHTHIHIFRLYSHAKVTQQAIDEHRKIVEAICERDPVKAAKAMRAHIEKSRKRVMSVFS